MRSDLIVHYLDDLAPQELAELTGLLDPGIQLTSSPQVPKQAQYQILVAGRPTKHQLSASPDLQTLIIPWAGVPEPTRLLAAEFPS